MLNTLLSPTRFVSFETLAPADLCLAVSFQAKDARKVVLVRDARPSALVDALAAGLAGSFELVVLDKVRPDPLAADISAMAGDCDLGGVDAVIGLGGGSVMDSAKALAMLAENGGSLEDYLGPSPARRIERKGRPLILVPTTAGTGSEATKVGVYTAATGRKYTLGSPLLQADVALLAGNLAASMPPALAAATGFDALSHALESIWNKNATPLSLLASRRAALLVLRALGPAWEASVAAAAGHAPESHNLLSLRMLEAAAMAGVAFSGTGTAMVHALSFILSEEWHVPHGTACAFTLEDAWRLQARDPEVASRLSALGMEVFRGGVDEGDAERSLLSLILDLKKSFGLPASFADLGIRVEKRGIRKLFERSFEDPKMANSFPTALPDEVYAFLEAKAL